jgi:hypothetical protein
MLHYTDVATKTGLKSIKLVLVRKYGLDVYAVLCNGELLATYMSERYAMTYYRRLVDTTVRNSAV